MSRARRLLAVVLPLTAGLNNMRPISRGHRAETRTALLMQHGGKGFGGGEATRDPEPTMLDPSDPKAKQQAIHKAESFAEYLARRQGGGDDATAVAGLEYASSCFIPTTWLALPLIRRREYNRDTTIYTFGLPDDVSLNLPVCACLLLRAPGRGRAEGGGRDDFDGSDAVRPYTPISDNSMLGQFELLVKRYDGGAVSQYLHSLQVGTQVEFKHIKFNIKAQYPFEGKSSFTMLCAGTGVAPMYQALWKLLDTPGDERPVTFIYGNKSPDDILLKEELDRWAAACPTRLKLVHVVGEAAEAAAPPGWESTPTYVAETGWIDQAKIARYAFPPSADTMIMVCGLPGMYAALCGPRGESELAEGTVLHALGYTTQMVAKM